MKNFVAVKLLVCLLAFDFSLRASDEKPMVVIIPSYNNIQWFQKNLRMALSQSYHNFRVIYIDDCSPDGTGAAVKQYLKKHDKTQRAKLISNQTRLGAMSNLYHAIHSCADDEIAVLLDGDDWFYHKNVLKQLNEVYSSGQVWFTHGTLLEYPFYNVTWNEPYPEKIIKTRAYRSFKCPSHLRTFYVWLFKKIDKENFLYNGDFLKMAWDMAIMYPISEMAEERHAFIQDPNYVYNMANPINDNKVDPELQNFLDRLIRQRTPYPRLESSSIPSGY